MRVTVAFFATMRDAAGTAEERVDLPDGATVEVLLLEVRRTHPALRPLAGETLVSVNGRAGAGATALRDGDRVALLPPLSGG